MDKITFCIPSKDNLRYLKTCIPSIRKNAFRDDHDIIIFVDEDNDGTIEWLEQVKDQYNLKYYVNPTLGEKLYGIGKAYDYCIDKSNTDIFMIFHADMMLGKHADKKAFDLLKPKTVVCSTRVEPPLHPNAGEKILMDFGIWPEEFKENEFDKYVEKHINDDKITEGIFAPWMMYKDEFQAIGGHDPRMHSCREDSDVFNRLLLDNFTFQQPWNSLVYHLTGRGAGSFSGDEKRHEEWKKQMNNSTKEFIRKWGSNIEHTSLMKPIVTPVYKKKLILINANENVLSVLEPWFTEIAVDIDINKWVEVNNKDSYFDLSKRVYKHDNNSQEAWDDIFITLDSSKFTQQDYNHIMLLNKIITDSGEANSVFQLGNLTIKINQLKNYQNELIKI